MEWFKVVLWPAFMVAALAAFFFFMIIDPQQLYLFGEPVSYPAIATYSIAFLGFWLLCSASSALSLFLYLPPDRSD